MSTLKVNTLEEATVGGATFYTAKAWVNFDGTGTVAIQADENISSLTDIGTGNYRITFTNNVTDENFAYSIQGYGASVSSGVGYSYCAELQGYSFQNASYFQFAVGYPANNIKYDLSSVSITVVR